MDRIDGMTTGDPFDLQRFVTAQARTYAAACAELRRGRKTSHWMWFIFPQLKGLGASPMAQHYGIASRAEAEAYLGHPILGPRLQEVTRIVLAHRGTALRAILDTPDDLKFRSSMTLFTALTLPGSIFAEALDAFCGGVHDQRTLSLIS